MWGELPPYLVRPAGAATGSEYAGMEYIFQAPLNKFNPLMANTFADSLAFYAAILMGCFPSFRRSTSS